MSQSAPLPRIVANVEDLTPLGPEHAYKLISSPGGPKFIAVCLRQDDVRSLVVSVFHPGRNHVNQLYWLRGKLEEDTSGEVLFLGAGRLRIGRKRTPIVFDSDTIEEDKRYGYYYPGQRKFPIQDPSEQAALVSDLQLIDDPDHFRALGYGDHYRLKERDPVKLELDDALLMTILMEFAQSISREGEYYEVGFEDPRKRFERYPHNGYVYDQATGKRTYYDNAKQRQVIRDSYRQEAGE